MLVNGAVNNMVERPPADGYDLIMERLYTEYYAQNKFSSAASSYWQEHGSLVKDIKKGNDFIISGASYGQVLPRTFSTYLYNITPGILNRYLICKYRLDRRIIKCGFQIARMQGRILDYNCARQVLCVNTIFKNINFEDNFTAAVIGDDMVLRQH